MSMTVKKSRSALRLRRPVSLLVVQPEDRAEVSELFTDKRSLLQGASLGDQIISDHSRGRHHSLLVDIQDQVIQSLPIVWLKHGMGTGSRKHMQERFGMLVHGCEVSSRVVWETIRMSLRVQNRSKALIRSLRQDNTIRVQTGNADL
ncbi:MAG: hypothetical protein K0S45_1723 [Nitrospira sp.]|jgi:hypothetical protein|nr:hypothetical protein [Nitrospira sp.]